MRTTGVLMCLSVLAAAPAAAWDSKCFQYTDPAAAPDALQNPVPCAPEAGPNTARHRWIGPLDEHRQLWEETRVRAGLPPAVSMNAELTVFTGSAQLGVGDQSLPTLVPAPFDQVERVRSRTFTVGELAQLPDFSYALWDWALGHETCPLGAGLDPVQCHDFATHMGPVNSNHFLPQAGAFYAHYHALALGRAAACRQMKDAVGPHSGRFAAYLRACELQALALEAVGQHYLQDAWSTGHMWQRWGAPDLQGFGGTDPEDQRERAVLVALVSGLIHGSRSVLQRLPEWTSFDVNDAMCAPHDAVTFTTHDGHRVSGVGDDYLHVLASHTLQSERFFSCAASGMLDVYEASGQLHGALGPPSGGWTRVDPVGPLCFGQRATNRALLQGMGTQLKVAGNQLELPLDGKTVSLLVPQVAQTSGAVSVQPKVKHRFRLELIRMVSVARVVAHDAPNGTELADGRLGTFLGAQPNARHLQPGAALASYIDPPLPWPDRPGASDAERGRAEGLARVFHRAHADDWCRTFTLGDLEALRTRASDASAAPEARLAACDVCGEFAARHLRVGSSSSWDPAREPLCHSVAASPAYVFQDGTAEQSTEELARIWCGCAP